MTGALALAVIVAGGLGAVLRYLVTLVVSGREPLPWAVFAVNVIGSAIGGVVLGLAERGVIGDDIRLVLLTGLAGGLTTFSTFSVETLQLVAEGKWRAAIGNVAANLAIGFGVAALAYALTR